MLSAFIDQYCFWTLNHAIGDPIRHWVGYFALICICPSLIFICLFARRVNTSWLIVISLVGLENLVTPNTHYMLIAVPFLCLIAGNALIAEKRKSVLAISAILSIVLFIRMGAAVIRPFGIMGLQRYSIAEVYKQARNMPYDPYTHLTASFIINNWPLPTNSFLDQLERRK